MQSILGSATACPMCSVHDVSVLCNVKFGTFQHHQRPHLLRVRSKTANCYLVVKSDSEIVSVVCQSQSVATFTVLSGVVSFKMSMFDM